MAAAILPLSGFLFPYNLLWGTLTFSDILAAPSDSGLEPPTRRGQQPMKPEEKALPGTSPQKAIERLLEVEGWRFSKFERLPSGGFALIGTDGAGQPVVLMYPGPDAISLDVMEAALAAQQYYHQGRGRTVVLSTGRFVDDIVQVAQQTGIELWAADAPIVQAGLYRNPRDTVTTLGKAAPDGERALSCPSCGKWNRLDWTQTATCVNCGRPLLPSTPSFSSPLASALPSPPAGTTPPPSAVPKAPPPSPWPPRWLGGLVVIGVLGVIVNLAYLSNAQRFNPGNQPVGQPSLTPGRAAAPYSATPPDQIPAPLRPFPEVITGHLINNQVMFPAELVGPTGKTAPVEVIVDSGNANLDGVYEPIAESVGLVQTGTRLLLGIQGPATVQPQYGGFTLIPQGQYVAGQPGSSLQVPEAIGLPQIVGGSTVNLGQETLGHEAQFVEVNGQWWFGWYPAPAAQPPATPPPAPPGTPRTLPDGWKAWTYHTAEYTAFFALPPSWTQVPSLPNMWQGPEYANVSFNVVSTAERVPILRPGIWGPQSSQNIPYIANGYDTRIFYQQLGADTYAMVEVVLPVQQQDLAVAIAETMRFVPNAP